MTIFSDMDWHDGYSHFIYLIQSLQMKTINILKVVWMLWWVNQSVPKTLPAGVQSKTLVPSFGEKRIGHEASPLTRRQRNHEWPGDEMGRFDA